MAKKNKTTAAQVETATAPAVAAPETVAAQPAPEAAPAPAETAAPKAKRGKKAATETTPTAEPTTAPAAAPKPKVPGVALLNTRPFIAGQIIARMGLAAGVTDAMVAELDAAYQGGRKPNPIQSKFDLQSAWHALRGFTGWKPEDAK